MPDPVDTFLNGANAVYLSELYARFLDNPDSVDAASAHFFSQWQGDQAGDILREVQGASWNRHRSGVIGHLSDAFMSPPSPKTKAALRTAKDSEDVRKATLDSIRALMLIRSYRVRGHLHARFDPLGLEGKGSFPELEPATYGFLEGDMDRPIFIDHVLGLESATLREILQILKKTYCSSVGVEFMHIQNVEQKSWIQRRIESSGNRSTFTVKGKMAILERLIQAEQFERFLQKKFTGTKRFGLEGGESLIPALEQILKRGAQLGIRDVVLGMAHRGRLNVLANVMQKPYKVIFFEFQGGSANPEDVQGSGDVRYHLGASADRIFDGHPVHLTLNPNPSHLELVNPVVLGKVRSKQSRTSRNEAIGVLLHGDAAFAGQGLVSETLALSGLEGYTTGGTLHIIVNNQIGFTTNPSSSRSSPYPSDVGKMIQAPIFHVNGDDPEAVVHAVRLAVEFRQEFSCDVIVDMFCYRRHGHNESDEPMFTQPIMYRTIAKHPTTAELYARQLDQEGLGGREMASKMRTNFDARLEDEFIKAQDFKPDKADWLAGGWKGITPAGAEEEYEEYQTAVAVETLKEVGQALSTVPSGVAVNTKIVRQLRGKAAMMASGSGIDWATAEALAFGTLLVEGVGVRLSGQDCGRGTFSQRQSVLVDQENESRYYPLNHIRSGQSFYKVYDSPLAEASVLGFEYGYASDDPFTLVLWEAQFGDFANGAQMIIDQFLTAGESKWLRLNGLVLLLPHGYEGQGPEHSSARPERFLQLCAEDNLQVCNLTTPANYFHALRRQIRRNFRKPLIVFTPKSLLRHPGCVSNLEDFSTGSQFKRVIPETAPLVSDLRVRRVVLCTGKVYYDLLEGRIARGIDNVALIRVEQLYPWPRDTLLEEIKRYPAADVVWCQEEPANMGAWTFVFQRLMLILKDLARPDHHPGYAGRTSSASPATGLHKKHVAEQKLLVDQALSWAMSDLPIPFRRVSVR